MEQDLGYFGPVMTELSEGRGQRNKEREKAEHVWASSGGWSQFDSIGPLLKEIVTELGQHKLGACVTYLHICH